MKTMDKSDPVEKELYEDSMIRCRQAQKILAQSQNQTVEQAKKILGDRENGSHAICAEYKFIMGAQIGTVCSVIMDLQKLEMHITMGNPIRNDYQVIPINLKQP
jgi:hypothetical protein